MIRRELELVISSKLFKKKAIILVGAPQVGKTTLLRGLFQNRTDALWLNADELYVQTLFSTLSASRLKAILGEKRSFLLMKHNGLRASAYD
ncbi:MAG: hypothetical protein AAGU19_06035 [Prolixibacteraceae bacterium]